MSDVKRYFWDGKYNYAESLNAPIDFPLGVKYVLEKDYQALKQENKTLRKISEDTADQRNRYMAEVYDLEQELKKVKTRCHILIGEKTDIKNKLNESRSTTRILRGNWCKAEKENKKQRELLRKCEPYVVAQKNGDCLSRNTAIELLQQLKALNDE